MGDLLVDQRLRDDADDAAAGGKRRIGHLPHQPDAGAAVDERHVAAGDLEPLLQQLQLSLEDEAALLAFMMHHAGVDGTMPAADALFRAIAVAGSDNPLPAYADAIDELTHRLERAAETGPELELLLAAGFVRYAIANRHGNLAYVREDVAAAQGWDVEDESQREDIVRALAGQSFRAGVAEGFSTVLPELRPQFAQYERLVAGVAEYRGYVEAGGWETLDIEGSLERDQLASGVDLVRPGEDEAHRQPAVLAPVAVGLAEAQLERTVVAVHQVG